MAVSIMVQGTMSNVGKSLVAAGLCRIFRQDGYRVAPFKSQNMALNSFITDEGLEMGRAQVMQAEAAGIEPSARMNPILLKPTGEMGSQVIVCGEVVGNMVAADYYRYKKTLRPVVAEAYRALAERVDIVVIEGAGSPAEINLKSDDFVNMGMAAIAGAPVLMVGDIDRGGVFASLCGTLSLLEPEERQRVRGLLINKFRGDVEILRPGLRMLEERAGVPVVGVLPHLPLDLDDEDSLADRLHRQREGVLDIAVIRLPHLSNFTDFAPLERHPLVGLRYVDRAELLGRPDLLILPGTKNTMDDLNWLRTAGFERPIRLLHAQGTPVMGICGGYQILGEQLDDPDGIETGGSEAGLGLLPCRTRFEPHKTRTRVTGQVCCKRGVFAPLDGCPVEGYEIHMGRTDRTGAPALRLAQRGADWQDGAVGEHAFGSYLHGLFDRPELVDRLVGLLLDRRGLSLTHAAGPDSTSYKEEQYNRLADAMRRAIDLPAVYRMMGLTGRKGELGW